MPSVSGSAVNVITTYGDDILSGDVENESESISNFSQKLNNPHSIVPASYVSYVDSKIKKESALSGDIRNKSSIMGTRIIEDDSEEDSPFLRKLN